MASIHKDFIVDANPNDVWDALRDFSAVHQRLAPGFVAECRMDGHRVANRGVRKDVPHPNTA